MSQRAGLAFEPLEDRSLLAAIAWDGGGNGTAWSDPLNWSGNVLPGPADDVTIGPGATTITYASGTTSIRSLHVAAGRTLALTIGTLSLAAESAIEGTLNHTGGTLSGAGELVVRGAYAAAGIMSGSGKTTIADTGTLSIVGNGHVWSRTFDNFGTATWNTGGIWTGAGTFNNHGTFTVSSGGALVLAGSSSNAFNNLGTFIKSGTGSLTADPAKPFNNSGTVDVQAGTLTLRGGGTNHGVIQSSAGTTLVLGANTTTGGDGSLDAAGALRFENSTHTFAAGNFRATGPLTITSSAVVTVHDTIDSPTVTLARSGSTGGTLIVHADQSFESISLDNGTLNGSGDVTITGSMSIQGSTLTGTGKTIVAPGATVNILQNASNVARTLENHGTVTQSTIVQYWGAAVHNYGSYGVTAGSLDGWQGNNAFFNYGTFRKTGAGTFELRPGNSEPGRIMVLNNEGTIDIQQGTLGIHGGGTSSGVFQAAAGTTLTLRASYNYAAGHAFDVDGTVIFQTGNHTFDPGTSVRIQNMRVAQLHGAAQVQVVVNTPIDVPAVTLQGQTAGLTVTIPQTFETFATTDQGLGGGFLWGTADVTFTGSVSLNGGGLRSTGRKTIVEGASLTVGAQAASIAGVLDNYGTATITSLQVDGATFNNYGEVNLVDFYVPGGFHGAGFGGHVINYGVLRKSGAGEARFSRINGDSTATAFTNHGLVEITAGALRFDPSSLSNLALNTLTGGTWVVAGTLTLPGSIQTIAANIKLNGPGSRITVLGGTTDALAGLRRIAPGGSLTLSGGRGMTLANFENAGTLRIGAGSTLTVEDYTQADNATLAVELTGNDNDGLLQVNDLATLAGTFKAESASRFTASHEPITFAAREGEFDGIDRGGLNLSSEYRSHSLLIKTLAGSIPVNTYTEGNQMVSSVAMDATGNFVVVWQNPADDSVFFRRFAADGHALDVEELQVNTYVAPSNGVRSSVAMDAAGNFVVVWSTNFSDLTTGVYFRRFAADGSARDIEAIQIDDDYFGYAPSVAMGTGGNFVVAWATQHVDTNGWSIHAKRFDADGQALDDDAFRVNAYASATGFGAPSVAMDVRGNFVVAWDSPQSDTSGIYARRFDADGQALDEVDIPISTQTETGNLDPSVAMDAGGNFVVAWYGHRIGSVFTAVYARRFDAGGQALDEVDVLISTPNAPYQAGPSVAMDAEGNFVVTWAAHVEIVGRRFAANGNSLDTKEFLISDGLAGVSPSVAMNGRGDFVVSWDHFSRNTGEPGNYADVHAQRYSSQALPTVLAVLTESGEDVNQPYFEQTYYPTSLTVRFSGPMSEEGGATGRSSVWNPENYAFTEFGHVDPWETETNGPPIDRVIVTSYGLNAATGYYEAVLAVSRPRNGSFPKIAVSGSLESADGVPLDGDGNLQPGGDYLASWHLAVPLEPSEEIPILLSSTTVLEHQPAGTIVGDLTGHDDFYILAWPGTDHASFDIVDSIDTPGPAFDRLVATDSFDYAEKSSYTVIIYGIAVGGNYHRYTAWTFTINVLPDLSEPLAAHAGGPYTMHQGESLELDGGASTGSIDAFAWDLDGDGVYETAGQTAAYGQLTPGTYTVGLRITGGGEVSTATATVTVLNRAPLAGISGPSIVVSNQLRTFTLTAEDVSADDSFSGVFLFTVDWGDGSPIQHVALRSGEQVTHAFRAAGSYIVKVAAADRHVEYGASSELAVEVLSWALQPNADHPELMDLVWGGTAGMDAVRFEEVAGAIRVRETILDGLPIDVTYDVAGVTGRVIALGGSGDDVLDARGLATIQATLNGDAGNNTLYGGAAGDILIGGSDGGEGQQGSNVILAGDGPNTIYGNDVDGAEGATGGNHLIVGGSGNDTIFGSYERVLKADGSLSTGSVGGSSLIVGGGGSDTIHASQDIEGGLGSILVSGSTSLEQSALLAVLDEWTSGRTLDERLANIAGTGSGPRENGDAFLQAGVTLFDDDAADLLFSDSNGDPNWLLTHAEDELRRLKDRDRNTAIA